uniref:SJCHGC09728 protein n=1 Tax=Schistosoma japonicum TaxID=6182 RepID=Q5BR14_SCHJA|nr:SJCHGC09728 protein [Schistosoma japonicum]
MIINNLFLLLRLLFIMRIIINIFVKILQFNALMQFLNPCMIHLHYFHLYIEQIDYSFINLSYTYKHSITVLQQNFLLTLEIIQDVLLLLKAVSR